MSETASPKTAASAPAAPATAAPAIATPQLADIRQVSDGWIKKYLLTYTMPDAQPTHTKAPRARASTPTAPSSRATRVANNPPPTLCALCRRLSTENCCSSANFVTRSTAGASRFLLA